MIYTSALVATNIETKILGKIVLKILTKIILILVFFNANAQSLQSEIERKVEQENRNQYLLKNIDAVGTVVNCENDFQFAFAEGLVFLYDKDSRKYNAQPLTYKKNGSTLAFTHSGVRDLRSVNLGVINFNHQYEFNLKNMNLYQHVRGRNNDSQLAASIYSVEREFGNYDELKTLKCSIFSKNRDYMVGLSNESCLSSVNLNQLQSKINQLREFYGDVEPKIDCNSLNIKIQDKLICNSKILSLMHRYNDMSLTYAEENATHMQVKHKRKNTYESSCKSEKCLCKEFKHKADMAGSSPYWVYDNNGNAIKFTFDSEGVPK